MTMKLPDNINKICDIIYRNNFKVYIVGGVVRDMYLNKEPKDWDIITDSPAEFIEMLPYKVIKTGKDIFDTYKIVIGDTFCDISVLKGDNIEQDLLKRDFTINAIAYDIDEDKYIDPAGGIEDIQYNKLIKAVNNPEKRFEEDPLRMLRAIRLSVELDFTIEENTYETICEMAYLLEKSSNERIRDEFSKIMVSQYVEKGVFLLKNTGLLNYIIPELLEGDGMPQRGDHLYDVLEHNIKTAAYIRNNLNLRLAALLHDVGKPRTLVEVEGVRSFPAHDKKSAEMAEEILKRLRYPKETIIEVSALIGYHLFIYKPWAPKKQLIKLIAHLGDTGVMRLIELLYADRRAINPNMRLDYVDMMKEKVEKLLHDKSVIGISDLKIEGNDIKEYLNIKSGPKVGEILEDIWDEVLEDPTLNKRDKLIMLIKKYNDIQEG